MSQSESDPLLARIRLKLATGEQIELSPGAQNLLVEQIIREFCPRFTPGGHPRPQPVHRVESVIARINLIGHDVNFRIFFKQDVVLLYLVYM